MQQIFQCSKVLKLPLQPCQKKKKEKKTSIVTENYKLSQLIIVDAMIYHFKLLLQQLLTYFTPQSIWF